MIKNTSTYKLIQSLLLIFIFNVNNSQLHIFAQQKLHITIPTSYEQTLEHDKEEVAQTFDKVTIY